jgi:hypothetical protein
MKEQCADAITGSVPEMRLRGVRSRKYTHRCSPEVDVKELIAVVR